MTRCMTRMGLAAAMALAAGVASDTALGDFETGCELVTITPAGVQVEYSVPQIYPQLSGDGRYVVFQAQSDAIVGPTPADYDVFLKDRLTGAIELISVNTAGEPGDANSGEPHITADGQLVTFVSGSTNLGLRAPVTPTFNIWVRDRTTGITEQISLAANGGAPNDSSFVSDISDDGRHVVFVSLASNLISRPAGNGWLQLFVRDRLTQTTALLSNVGGELANNHIFNPRVSSDGRFITFYSLASNLVPGDTNGTYDVFVADRVKGTIERVSITDDEQQAVGGPSQGGYISDDGSRVFFFSLATNLVADFNGQRHSYVRDRAAGTTRIMTLDENGQQSSGSSGSLSISGDGKYVAFRTAGSLVGADQNASDDVYRVRVDDGAIDLVSISIVTGLASGGSAYSTLDFDGSEVAFRSESSSLVTFDQNGVADYFARPMPVTLPGDLDGDNSVGGADLAILLGAWGTAGNGDLDGDGIVGGADLAILLGAWTP